MTAPGGRRVPLAVVVTDGATCQPTEVIVVFANPAQADHFARQHGLDDFTVTPVRLAADMDDIHYLRQQPRPRTRQ